MPQGFIQWIFFTFFFVGALGGWFIVAGIVIETINERRLRREIDETLQRMKGRE